MRISDMPLWTLMVGALFAFGAVGVPAGLLAARRHRRGKRAILVLMQALLVQLAAWWIIAVVVEQASFHLRVHEVEAKQGASVVLLDQSFGPLMLRRVVNWPGVSSGVGGMDFTWEPGKGVAIAGLWTAISSVLMGLTWWAMRSHAKPGQSSGT
jgi:hypothetical protein